MNNKFFVPFETAKLLREKGYNEKISYAYNKERRIVRAGVIRAGVIDCNNTDWDNLRKVQSSYPPRLDYIAAPTYHEVVDWLYEKKICITCHPAYSYEGQYNGFQYEMQTYDEDDYKDDIYRTREEALNAAILKAIEML